MFIDSRSNDAALEALLANRASQEFLGQQNPFALQDQIALRTIAVAFRRPDGSPYREIINGGNRSVGEYVSYKSQLRLAHESSHEKLGHYLTEVDPKVFHAVAQPHTLIFLREGVRTQYAPDVELWTEADHVVREVKESEELRNNIPLRQKLEFVSEIYGAAGFRFQVITDREIRTEPRLANATLVQRYRRLTISYEQQARVVEHLEKRGGVSSFADCTRSLKFETGAHEFVMAMMCQRTLRIDFAKPIGPQSAVFRHHPIEPEQPSIAIRRPRWGSQQRVMLQRR